MAHRISCMPFLVFFALLIIFPYFSSSAPLQPFQCHPDDQKVLLQIKNYFNNSTLFSSWLPGTDCCNYWEGIGCRQLPRKTTYRVNFLEIDGAADLVSTIPSVIADLPYLNNLILSNLPNLTGPIPPAIGKLTQLGAVLLDGNNLTGPIPNFFSTFKQLAVLILSNNQLTGTIPSFLGHLPNLIGLDLSNNQLSGTIPASFGSFQDATSLFLSNNKLSGSIPKSLGNVKFEIVELYGNRLTGDASVFFGANNTMTVRLNLANNLLSFDLSDVVMPVGQFNSSFKKLDLSHNKIYGRLPEWLGEAPFLEFLNVSYNQLCGPIPTAGGKLQQLFNASSFEHNKCLCGAPLPPCKSL